MKLKSHGMALVAVAGIAVCAGLALAQAPDAGPGGPPAPAGPRGAVGARAMGAPGGPGGFAQRMGGVMLLSAPGAKTEVANTEKGVDVAITAEKPEDVARVQEAIQAGVMQTQQIAENVRARLAGQPARGARAERGLFLLLASGDANVSAKKTDKGMVVSLTSDKPEVVQTIQQNAPQWVAEARDREKAQEEMRARMEKVREAAVLVANEDVKLDVKETDNGITVQITSPNPDLAKQIKNTLPAGIEGLKEIAKTGAAAAMGGPGGPLGGPGGPLRGMRRGGPGAPGAPVAPRPEGPPPEAAR